MPTLPTLPTRRETSTGAGPLDRAFAIVGVLAVLAGSGCQRDEVARDFSGFDGHGGDARALRDSGDAADTARQDVPESWTETPRAMCPPDVEPVGPERLSPPDLPADVGATPEVAWEQSELCPAGSPLLEGAPLRVGNRVVMGRFALKGAAEGSGGGEQSVVVATLRREERPVGLTMVRARDGQPIACHRFPFLDDEMSRRRTLWMAPRLVVNSAADRVHLLTGLSAPRGCRIGCAPDVAVTSWSIDGVDWRREFEDVAAGERFSGLRLRASGQLVAAVSAGQILSLRPDDGASLWRLEVPGQPDAESGERLYFRHVHFPPTGLLQVTVVDERSDEEFYLEVDACGRAERVQPDPVGWRIGEYRLRYAQHGMQVLDADGRVVEAVHRCRAKTVLVTPSAERIGCIRGDPREYPERELVEFVSARLDGSNKVECQVDPQDHEVGGLLSHRDRLTVGAGDVWLVHVGSRLYLMPMADGECADAPTFVELPTPSDAPTAPLVTASGMVVVAAAGRLYGIQTDLPGLADAPFPRGPRGGNENRGAVGGNSAGLTSVGR